MKRIVGIFIFDEVEVLDFAGPFEVFSVTSQLNNHEYFDVLTIGRELKPVSAINGLSVNPDHSFDSSSKIDILIVPGGNGTRKQMEDEKTLGWIEKVHQETELTLSICSGSRLLGKLQLLDNQPYCTHHQSI